MTTEDAASMAAAVGLGDRRQAGGLHPAQQLTDVAEAVHRLCVAVPAGIERPKKNGGSPEAAAVVMSWNRAG